MKKLSFLATILVLVVVGLIYYLQPVVEEAVSQLTASPTPSPSVVMESGLAEVTKVVDGDTIEVRMSNGQLAKVRFIGVDTPETVDPNRGKQCFGQEASDETKSLLNGQQVYLEKDISESDKYGRLLRYVYVGTPDGQKLFVNDYLVREGFAQVSTYPPDVKFTDQFLEAQRQAQAGQLGLWAKCKVDS